METVAVLCLALGFDWMLGDPPNRWHPVGWMGRLIASWGRPTLGAPWLELFWGAAVVATGLIVVVVPLDGVQKGLNLLAVLPRVLLEAFLLKLVFSLRGLCHAAWRVQKALEAGDLELSREHVGRDLVSRPTATLSAPFVASAVVESVAENLTDSVVAPLSFYLVLGLPGAYAYRFVNTADAMVGYRDAVHEYLGKSAARLDDLLNFIPARLAALSLVIAAPVAGGRARGAWRMAWSQHERTASPNAGWTMAAMAGALGVTLEKPGQYQLGVGPFPGPHTIGQAVRLVQLATLLLVLVAASVALGLAMHG